MYHFDEILKIFNASNLDTPQYQNLMNNIIAVNDMKKPISHCMQHLENLLDTSLIQLFCKEEEFSCHNMELNFVMNELRPTIVSKVYLYVCNSLVEDFPVKNINRFFAQFCNQYTLLDLDAVKELLKKPKREFFRRVITYEDPHGFNPYYLSRNFSNIIDDLGSPKGIILENYMDYLYKSINFNTDRRPDTINVLIPALYLIFINNYSLLPGHGNHKNGFSFNDLNSFEIEIERILLENNYKTTIDCKYTKLLCKTLIDELLPFNRIKNTIDIYRRNHFDSERRELLDPRYGFLSLYYVLMDLPTISLQNHFANELSILHQNNLREYSKETSSSIFSFWDKLSNISKIIYPLGIIYLFKILWTSACQHCGDAAASKVKLIYVKNKLENYIEKSQFKIESKNEGIISFSKLSAELTSTKSIETDIIYELLSPYNHTIKNIWGINGQIENHRMPFSEIHERTYYHHL